MIIKNLEVVEKLFFIIFIKILNMKQKELNIY